MMALALGRLAVFAITFLAFTVACDPEPTTHVIRGLVVNVQVASLTKIGSFDLRGEDGQTVSFVVEGNPGITPSHLREHMVLAEPVTVTYHRSNDLLVATQIDD
jgi:hypothetical protein